MKKALSSILALCFVLALFPVTAGAQTAEQTGSNASSSSASVSLMAATSVDVSVSVQKDGENILYAPYYYSEPYMTSGPKLLTVYSNAAEAMGYTDSGSGVTLLDVLVTAHRVFYNKTTDTSVAAGNYDASKVFNVNNREQYLKVTNELRPTTSILKDYVTRLFGYEVSGDVDWTFTVNGVRPNGGLYPCGAAYMYTSITDTLINTSDSIAFYIPSDAEYVKSAETIKYGASNDKDSDFYQYNLADGSKAADGKYQDQYVWLENSSGQSDLISAPLKKDLALTVKGFPYLTTYGKYGTFADYQSIAKPVSGVKIGLLDTNGTSPYNNGNADANGKITPVGDYVSDADGKITISKDESFLQTAGTYTLVAYRTAADGAPVLMHKTTLITSKSGLDPSLEGYVAPESMTVTSDKSDVMTLATNLSGATWLVFIPSAKNGNQIKFTALDQNGKETPAIWSINSTELVFEDAFDGTLTIPNYVTGTDGLPIGHLYSNITITATSRLNGKTAIYKFITGTAQMSLGVPDASARELTGSPMVCSAAQILQPMAFAQYGLVDYTISDLSIMEIEGIRNNSSSIYYTLKRPGTTYLTVYEKANPYHCTVIPVTVTGVVIENKGGVSGSDTMYIGESIPLTAYVADPKNTGIAWSSSDPEVAEVDTETGRVTAVATGEATITATCTTDGGTPYSGTFKVTVKDTAIGGLDSLMVSGPVSSTNQRSRYYNNATGSTVTPAMTGMDFEGGMSPYAVKYTDCYSTGKNLTFYINPSRDDKNVKTGTQRVFVQPSFDGEAVKTELYVNNELVKELESDKSAQIPLTPGTSTAILIRASSRSNPENFKEYKFTIVFPDSTDATFNLTKAPALITDRTLISTLKYNGQNEGQLWKLNAAGALNGTLTATSSISTDIKAFVYRDISAFSLVLTGTDAGYTHLRYKTGDENYVEGQGCLDIGPLAFGDADVVTVEVQSVADSVYAAAVKKGTDPWAGATTRKINVVRLDVDPTMSDFEVTDLNYSDGALTLPVNVMDINNPSQTVIVSKDAASITTRFKVTDGMIPAVSGATSTLIGPDADGYYSFTVNTSSGTAFVETIKLTRTIGGYVLAPTNTFTLSFSKTDTTAYSAYLPDSVTDYLCVGSQYTNGALSNNNIVGTNPERTLLGISNGSNQISLGSFGGYATYYFADPITNDPQNPYGVDFTVYGYGGSGSDAVRSKPGVVYVSEDGSTWYELAGSEHYDSSAIWNYKVTYTNNGGGNPASFEDNHDRSGSLGSGLAAYGYPFASSYTLHSWTEAENSSMSFTGTLLLGSNGWDYAESGTAAPTKWGYGGTKITPSKVSLDDLSMMTGNPYGASYQSSGSGFDLSWAVDSKGNPVSLTSVNYVKVMSASMIHASDADEASAVVFSVAKSAPFSYDNGTTSAPAAIKIGDKELKLEDGKYSYEAELSAKNFTVSVNASSGTNVYINNLRANTRKYTASDPFDYTKGILRIIVQENESAPLVYYVKLTTTEKDSGGTPSGGSSDGGTTPATNGNTAITTVQAKPDASGKASGVVTAEQVDSAIAAAVRAAESSGALPHVMVKAEGTEGADCVEVALPKSAFSSLVSGGIDALTVYSSVASLSFDKKALQTISTAATGDVSISAARLSPADLPQNVQDKVGNHPVYDFTVKSLGQSISQLNGTATVAIPYTPAAREDPNAIVIYWINDAGELETVSNAHYDVSTGTVIFTTTHFGRFAVGYNQVSFSDVLKGSWYYDAVSFIAARSITNGTDDRSFSPDAALTRGQFITLLLRAYDIAPDKNPADNFSDAGNTYYTGYLAAAKRLGISDGVGSNKFEPEKAITRQELFTLQYKALKIAGKLPAGASGRTLDEFTDSGEISSWAVEAMAYLVKADIISGAEGKLMPSATTTRAQMAQVLYKLLAK